MAPTPDMLARLPELDHPLPADPTDPAEVVRLLDEIGSPATVATAGPRYFGFVTGGVLPPREEADKVQGFRLGADDYVVKPVGGLEFLAGVEALLRRAHPRATFGVARFGDLEVDGDRRTAAVSGTEVELSPLEFDLLDALAQRRGNLMSRAELLKEVWGYRALVESGTVDTHVAKLRAKIDRGERSRIVTLRKRGDRMRA